MTGLALYLFGTLCRGAAIVLLLVAAERFVLPRFGNARRSRLYWIMLLVLVCPLAIFSWRIDFNPPPVAQPVVAAPAVNEPSRVIPQFEPVAEPPMPAAVAAAPSFNPMSALKKTAAPVAALYLGIAALLLVRQLIRWRRWEREVRRCRIIDDARIVRLFAAARRQTGTTARRVVLLDGGGLIATPACYGLRRGCVLFPLAEAGSRSDDEIAMLLVHELEHIRRRDHLTAFALAFAAAGYWFNPVFHLLRARLAAAREIECDAAVVRQLELPEDRRRTYARLLIDFHADAATIPGPGLSENAQNLKKRMMEVMMNRKTTRYQFPLLLLFAAFALAGLLTPAFGAADKATADADAEAEQLDKEVKAYAPPELQSGDWQKYNQVTREMVKEKKYREALIRHRWYFDHILDHQEAQMGVRLSFALSYWKELGELYPPALAEMKRLRDEKEAYLRSGQARLTIPVYNADGSARDFNISPPTTDEEKKAFARQRNGDLPVFLDVNGLNWALKEDQRTIDLFRELDQNQPEFAAKCVHRITELLIEHKEYQLARKYQLDPAKQWEKMQARIKQDISPERLKKTVTAVAALRKRSPDVEKEVAELRAVEIRMWGKKVAALIDFTRGMGEKETADRIEREADELLGQPAAEPEAPKPPAPAAAAPAATPATPAVADPLAAEVKAYAPPELQSGDWQNYDQVTNQMVKEKKYREALIRHRWYFDHILDYREAQTGVRLSFALSEWKELGELYPPALAEMKRLRDEKEAYLRSGQARLTIPVYNADGSVRDFKTSPPTPSEGWSAFQHSMAGDRPVFADVQALNQTLGEDGKTIELFRSLDEHQPEFAKGCIIYALDTLIAGKEFALAKKYVDAAKDWEKQKKRIKITLSDASIRQIIQMSIDQGQKTEDRAQAEAKLRASLVQVSRQGASRLITLARATGDDALADRIEREADELLAPPAAAAKEAAKTPGPDAR